MLEVLQQDYIRTATAKGMGQGGILFVHALKNAAVPIVTVIGIGFALLIGGAVVTESVFAIPGLGRLTVDAILRRDYPVIQGSRADVQLRLRAGQPGRRLALHAARSEDPLLSAPVLASSPMPCRRASPSRRRCRTCCRRVKVAARRRRLLYRSTHHRLRRHAADRHAADRRLRAVARHGRPDRAGAGASARARPRPTQLVRHRHAGPRSSTPACSTAPASR